MSVDTTNGDGPRASGTARTAGAEPVGDADPAAGAHPAGARSPRAHTARAHLLRSIVKASPLGWGGRAGSGAGTLTDARRSAYRASMDALLAEPSAEPRELAVHGTDGTPIRTLAYGPRDGIPIVLSHGWACNGTMWYPQINELAGDHRVICYDQRGHGGTPVGQAPATLDTLADDLAAVLRNVVAPSEPAVIVGHSMGGMAVAAWAARHPQDVPVYARGVLLASTAVDRLLNDFGVIPFPERLPGAFAIGKAAMAAPLSANLLPAWGFHHVAMGPDATAEQTRFCRRIVYSCTPRNRGRWGAAMSELDVADGLDALTVPTSVLVGTEDLLTPPVHAGRIAAHLEAAGHLDRLVEIPGAGHMTPVEAPYEVDAQIRSLACAGEPTRR